ncbi:hypothetical protein ACR6HW_08860 [Fusibacter sp. JL298sf-3]
MRKNRRPKPLTVLLAIGLLILVIQLTGAYDAEHFESIEKKTYSEPK